MTAIVGVGDGTTAWLATDGRNSYGHTAVADKRKRPIRLTLPNGEELGAVVAGYALTANMLRRWDPPALPDDLPTEDALSELAEDFGQYVMEEDTRWRRVVQQEDPGAHGSALILAYRGVVAAVDARFSITIDEHNRSAEGCGGELALVVAMASHDDGVGWPEALVRGLHYAAELDIHVGEPFSVMALGLHPGGIPERRQDDR